MHSAYNVLRSTTNGSLLKLTYYEIYSVYILSTVHVCMHM